jgi:hypothetical protein
VAGTHLPSAAGAGSKNIVPTLGRAQVPGTSPGSIPANMISDMGPNPFESSRLESQQFVSDERCRVHSSDSLTPTDSRGVQSGTLVENAIEVGGVTKTVVGMSDSEVDATSHERGQYDWSVGDHPAILPATTPAIAAAGPRTEFDLEHPKLRRRGSASVYLAVRRPGK